MIGRHRIVLGGAAALCLGAAVAFAHGGATGIVKERMDSMVALGKSSKAIGQMMRGQMSYAPEALATEARKIAAHGGAAMTRMFPDGTHGKPSEALPAIWESWDAFEALAEELTILAEALEASAETPLQGAGARPLARPLPEPQALAQEAPDVLFLTMGRTCSACHERFRLETD